LLRLITAYAQWLGSSEQVSTIMLSILNAATIIGMYFCSITPLGTHVPHFSHIHLSIGQLALGHVCDRYGYATSAVISSGVASLSVFLLWGFAGKSFSLLIAFAVIYGTFGSGFTSSFPSIVTDIAGTEYRKPILINGVFMLLRGIGNVVGNPIGSVILTTTSGAAGWADMSYFVGSTLIASAVCGAVIRFMPSQTA
jgi:MFS family permease